MKHKTLKILFVILASLVVLAIAVKIMNKPRPPGKIADASIIKSAKYVEIKRALRHYKFDKSDLDWYMISPFGYKADKEKLEELIYALPLVTISQVITKNEKTFPNYGLGEKERVNVKILDKSNDILADFTAGKQADFSTFYLCDEKCTAVRQGDGLNINFLTQPLTDWLDKTVLETSLENIIYVVIEQKKKYLKILKEKNEWFFVKNKNAREKYKISKEKTDKYIKPLLNEISYFRADKVIPTSGDYGESINFETYLKIEIGLSAKSVNTILNISEKNEDAFHYLKKVGNTLVTFRLPSYRIKPFLISYKDLEKTENPHK